MIGILKCEMVSNPTIHTIQGASLAKAHFSKQCHCVKRTFGRVFPSIYSNEPNTIQGNHTRNHELFCLELMLSIKCKKQNREKEKKLHSTQIKSNQM